MGNGDYEGEWNDRRDRTSMEGTTDSPTLSPVGGHGLPGGQGRVGPPSSEDGALHRPSAGIPPPPTSHTALHPHSRCF